MKPGVIRPIEYYIRSSRNFVPEELMNDSLKIASVMATGRMSGLVFSALIVLALACDGFGQVKVAAGDVKDTRRSDGFFNNLDVQLKINGEALAGAKGIRVSVSKALDDTGKNLINEEKQGRRFEELDSSNKGEAKIDIELKSPERRAMAVQEVSGNVDIFAPQKDPRSIIAVPAFLKAIGKPISSPALKAAGVEVIIWTKEIFEARKKAEEARLKKEMEEKTKKAEQSGKLEDALELLGEGLVKAFGSMFSSFAEMEENDIAFNVTDPGSKLISIDVEDEKGKPIERNGRMTIGGDPRTMIYNFKEKLPATARIRLFILTPRSVMTVPFKLAGIPLP